MAKSKLTDKDKKNIRELREQGIGNKALADQYGVSVQTIIRACKPQSYKKTLSSNKRYREKNAQQIYQTRKENSKTYKLEFHKLNDAEVIAHINKQESFQGYIRALILKDIEKEQ